MLETGEPELGFKCSVGEGKEKKILIVNRIPVTGEDGVVVGGICYYGHADDRYDCHGQTHAEYFCRMLAQVANGPNDEDHAGD